MLRPSTRITPIAENVWSQDDDIRLPGGMLLPSRATLVRLEDGSLLLHSPLALDDATVKEIEALGDVRFLVAPNYVHWMFLADAKKRFPKARVFASAGLEKKLAGVAFDPLPDGGVLDGIGDQLRVERIQGVPYMNEHVFLHQPSRSLVVSDLMFNVHACRGIRMQIFFRLVGAWKKTAQSRFWRFLVRDRAAAARSATAILGLDYERIVVAHGKVLEDDARARAREALAWMTAGSPPMLSAA